MTEPRLLARLPAHVWVMLGASTAGYALMLAAVAGLQSHSEAELMAAREPASAGVAELRAAQLGLEARLDAASAAYAASVDAYNAAGGNLAALHLRMAQLGALVAEIDGVSRSMPAAISLPVVRKTVSSTRSPSTQGTTGASGG
jgi:hypothetical protein